MADLTRAGLPGRVRVNRPVRRTDRRAPVVILLGLAGVAGLAALARARAGRRKAGAAGPAAPRPAGTALLAATSLAAAALDLRRGRSKGVVRLVGPAMSLVAAAGRLSGRGGAFARARAALQIVSAGSGLVRLGSNLFGEGERNAQPAGGAAARFGAPGALSAAALAGLAADLASLAASAEPGGDPIAGARRRLGVAAALLAASVLTDSAMEHYRGGYYNAAMFVPPVTAGLSLLASLQAISGEAALRPARDAVHATAIAVGVIGLGFHAYNIGKRPGGVSWLNLFYAAPFGAPAAMSLAGMVGFAAERLDPGKPAAEQRLLGLPFARAMAALVGVGIAGTITEVALLHFRGAFHNPAMWLPLSVPPTAAALMLKTALAGPDPAWLARGALWGTAALGVAGVGFHAYGISRNMGGWYNWSQNILAGPPLPAPPSFSALALAGLGVLDLIKAGR